MEKQQNTHETLSGTTETQMGSERSFGLIFASVFGLFGGWKLYAGQIEMGWMALGLCGALAFLGLFAPNTLKAPNTIWFQFGLLLHKIISPLVLGLLFFLTVTPTALIMRMLGKDLLNLRLDPEAESYWIRRAPPGPDPKSMNQQF